MFASLQGSLNDDDLEKELSAAKDMYNDLQSRFASHTASVIALSSAADARQRQLSAACGVGTEVMQQQVLDRLIASLKAKLALKRKPLDRGKSGGGDFRSCLLAAWAMCWSRCRKSAQRRRRRSRCAHCHAYCFLQVFVHWTCAQRSNANTLQL